MFNFNKLFTISLLSHKVLYAKIFKFFLNYFIIFVCRYSLLIKEAIKDIKFNLFVGVLIKKEALLRENLKLSFILFSGSLVATINR
jgi:hypothetical protein